MATPIPTNRASFTWAELAEVLGVQASSVPGGASTAGVVGVCTDSRAVAEGNLFVALRGDSFDGHRFTERAVALGARALVVSDAAALPAGVVGFVVPDTLVALGRIARAHRRRLGVRVVGITGSAGKTTTKELVRAALAATGLVVEATSGNLNNRVGAPMTLLALRDTCEWAVIELGTSEKGEIAALTEIAEPDVALITSIGLSHAAGIGTEADVAVEKGAILRGLRAGGLAVVLADDPRVEPNVPEGVRIVRYGVDSRADVRLVATELDLTGVTAKIIVAGVEHTVRVSIPSAVAATNACAALAVAIGLGRPLEQAIAGLASSAGVEGRMRPLPLAGGATVLDDTYNANPRSMHASIESAARLAGRSGGRLFLVLGDMKELGEHTTSAHEEIGREAARHAAASFLAVGEAMRHAARVARDLGCEAKAFATAADVALPDSFGSGDVILVKGSRSMGMERVVRALEELAPPAPPSSKEAPQ